MNISAYGAHCVALLWLRFAGQSPDTMAIMFNAAPLPAPAHAGPTGNGSPPSHRECPRSTARSNEHNSALCPLTRCLVTRLAERSDRSVVWLPSRVPTHRRILHASVPATARLILSAGSLYVRMN